MSATVTMEIPVDILESARMSLGDAKLELALSLFAACRLSLGKAAELAGLSVSRFQAHLGAREMGPHYSIEDALDDRVALSSLR